MNFGNSINQLRHANSDLNPTLGHNWSMTRNSVLGQFASELDHRDSRGRNHEVEGIERVSKTRSYITRSNNETFVFQNC